MPDVVMSPLSKGSAKGASWAGVARVYRSLKREAAFGRPLRGAAGGSDAGPGWVGGTHSSRRVGRADLLPGWTPLALTTVTTQGTDDCPKFETFLRKPSLYRKSGRLRTARSALPARGDLEPWAATGRATFGPFSVSGVAHAVISGPHGWDRSVDAGHQNHRAWSAAAPGPFAAAASRRDWTRIRAIDRGPNGHDRSQPHG